MLRRIAAIAAALAAVPTLAACGEEHEVTHGHTEGIYVTVDHLKYQVQISRILNAADDEDQAYVAAVPEGPDAELGDGEEWFGVFLRVANDTDEAHEAARDIRIEDTTGAEFEPIALDQDKTPLAYAPAELEPKEQLPRLGSIPASTTTQGALLLFKIPSANLENRPLELHIASPGGEPAAATVTLDI